MAGSRSERIHRLIEALNAVTVGEFSAIETKLTAAREELATLQEADLEKTVAEAQAHLLKGDLASFRRLVAQAVSRLGHLR